METTALVEIFKRLSQGSKQAVQNGNSLDDFENYMHVDRPIEKAVRQSMVELRQEGGGVLFLVGNAGDGKSHIIATLKKDFSEFAFHNDASESLSPELSAIDTLKIHLQEMDDQHLSTTNKKVVVNINLGKLSEFIDDKEVQEKFTTITKCAATLFDEDNLRHDQTARVRIVSFGNHQIFELYPEKEDNPVDSVFIRSVLSKITSESENNVFYRAYKETKGSIKDYNPVVTNYEILQLPEVQNSLVKIIIEAIIRFKLVITPRELFDCFYRLVVPSNYNVFNARKDFFSSLLPNILFEGSDNRILNCISLLDPLKYGNKEHNDKMSQLFTSIRIPKWPTFNGIEERLNKGFSDKLQEFFNNNRKNVEDISQLLLRFDSLLYYKTGCEEYQKFLSILCGYYSNDGTRLCTLFDVILSSIPHYYGSYTNNKKIVPFNIQGRKFKIFAQCSNLTIDNNVDPVPFNNENRNEFVVEIDTHWKMQTPLPVLKVDYHLFELLSNICKGRLALSSQRDQNLAFTQFIGNIVKQTQYQESLIILSADNQQWTLSKGWQNQILLK